MCLYVNVWVCMCVVCVRVAGDFVYVSVGMGEGGSSRLRCLSPARLGGNHKPLSASPSPGLRRAECKVHIDSSHWEERSMTPVLERRGWLSSGAGRAEDTKFHLAPELRMDSGGTWVAQSVKRQIGRAHV